MKNIEIPDDVYTALATIAQEQGQPPGEILRSLFATPAATRIGLEPLGQFILSRSFQEHAELDARYLALLGWIATAAPADFAEFVENEPSAGHYLRFSPDEILRTCRLHAAQQIDGTRYWAVMNISMPAKQRFVARLLEFVGYDAAITELACLAIGFPAVRKRFALRVA